MKTAFLPLCRMNQQAIISALARLGKSFQDSTNPSLETAKRKASFENLWFDEKSINHAVEAWASVLSEEKLNNWLNEEQMDQLVPSPKVIGIVMAGNVPLVGMHDLLCVLISGNIAKIKLSNDDKALMTYVVEELQHYNDWFKEHILIADKMNGLDAIIATGSNNTSRYFEYYFKDIPGIIRKNRNSVAVLTGDESPEELFNIGHDVFMHYGLGCRNVTHLLIPQGDSPTRFYDHIADHYEVLNHNKYANNYTYHRALFLLNKQDHLDNNFLLLKEDESLYSPVGCLNYSYYSSEEELENWISSNKEQIQVIVSKGNFSFSSVAPGQAQSPGLNDYSDNVNTLKFCYSLG